jgi:hypothetical protein
MIIAAKSSTPKTIPAIAAVRRFARSRPSGEAPYRSLQLFPSCNEKDQPTKKWTKCI